MMMYRAAAAAAAVKPPLVAAETKKNGALFHHVNVGVVFRTSCSCMDYSSLLASIVPVVKSQENPKERGGGKSGGN